MALVRMIPLIMFGMGACGSTASDGSATDSALTAVAESPAATSPSTIESTSSTAATATSILEFTTAGLVESQVSTTSAGLSMDFTFKGLDGLVAVEDPQPRDSPGTDQRTTAWSTAGGVTDAFLVLADVPAGAVDSPECDCTATRIDSPTGRLWLVTDSVSEVPPPSSVSRTMWWRDDGRLWIVSNYGLGPERLTALTLEIQLGTDGTQMLADPSMTLVGTSSLDNYASVSQPWTFNGQNLSIAVTNGGLARQLDSLTARSIVAQTIAGTAGYKVTLLNGQVNLMWPTVDPTYWGSVTSGPPLATSIDAIAAAVVRT